MFEQQSSVEHFVASARAYCTLLERAALLPPREYTEALVVALADLYAHALRLPTVEPCSQEYEDETILLPSNAHNALSELPVPQEDDEFISAGIHWLVADDLNDIYIDLLRAMRVYDLGTTCSIQDAIWEWKFSFDVHWRAHLVHALYTLDRIMREEMMPQEPKA